MKKVFGLFESAANTRLAVDNLVRTHVSENNLQIVSQDPASLGSVKRRPRNAPLAQLGTSSVRLVESNQPLSSQLRDLGLPAQELPYFSKFVRKGSVVLVVESAEDSADSVADIIRASDGKVS